MMPDGVHWAKWPVLAHCARTAVAAAASLLAARSFRLPEAYWAPITTLVITQSSLGAARTVSWHRFVGTALGAVGGVMASQFALHMLIFIRCVISMGLFCVVMRIV